MKTIYAIERQSLNGTRHSCEYHCEKRNVHAERGSFTRAKCEVYNATVVLFTNGCLHGVGTLRADELKFSKEFLFTIEFR